MMKTAEEIKNGVIGYRTRVILGSLAAVFLVPSVLGFTCSRICSGYWATGGLVREGSALIPDIITRMHFSALFEIMLICVIVAIGGVAAGIMLLKRPCSNIKITDKDLTFNRK